MIENAASSSVMSATVFFIRGTEETNVNFVEEHFCFHSRTLLSLTSEGTFENDMYDSGLVAEGIIDNWIW